MTTDTPPNYPVVVVSFLTGLATLWAAIITPFVRLRDKVEAIDKAQAVHAQRLDTVEERLDKIQDSLDAGFERVLAALPHRRS